MTKKILTIAASLTLVTSAFALDMFPGEKTEIFGTEVNCQKVEIDQSLPKCNTKYDALAGCPGTSVWIGEKVFGCASAYEAATIIIKLQRANQCR